MKVFEIAAGVVCACSALGACSSSPPSATPVPYPAPHPAMPRVVSKGGPVMTAPKLVTITFQGDPIQPGIDTFATQLAAASPYWSGATAEYGVGPLTALPPQHLSAMDFTTDADVQNWIGFEINVFPGMAQPDANTLYVVYMPAGAYLKIGTATLCGAGAGGFQGYHNDVAFRQNINVIYAVVGRCAPSAGASAMDQVSEEASRQILGAATDPLPTDGPAFIDVDPDHLGWGLVGGAEVGDMCATSSAVRPSGVTSPVQRAWSNAAAAASHDPCEPQGTRPYFNSAPVLADAIQLPGSPPSPTKGVSIPVGSSKTVELDLYSDAPTPGPWTVSALDLTSMLADAGPALSFSFDKTQGRNGDKVHLTITALAATPLGVAPFQIVSELGAPDAGGARTTWVGVVGN